MKNTINDDVIWRATLDAMSKIPGNVLLSRLENSLLYVTKDNTGESISEFIENLTDI